MQPAEAAVAGTLASAEQEQAPGCRSAGRCLKAEVSSERPAKRPRPLRKCASESSMVSDATADGLRGGRALRAGLPPDAAGDLREEISEAFCRGTGGRMEARPHQIDCIWEVLQSLRVDSLSHQQEATNYLLQHSTGSGKSLTIAALAHFLLKVRGDDGGPLFTSVIVVNDRIQLDKQLGDTVSAFLAGNGLGHLVHRASSCDDLRQALGNAGGEPAVAGSSQQQVVLTTLQKFRLQKLKQHTRGPRRGRVAVIADEAHRSHGSSTTELVHEVLSGSGKQPPWLTYVGFTATPSPMALQLFGVQEIQQAAPVAGQGAEQAIEGGLEEEFVYTPFHTYSMADAIADGHVLDVLRDYTTIAPHVQVLPAGQDGEEPGAQDRASTAVVQRVMQAAANHVDVVRSKAEYIADHFLQQLESGLPGDVRGMVVARSRQHVAWYVLELRRALGEAKRRQALEVLGLSSLGVYGAFSGVVPLNGNDRCSSSSGCNEKRKDNSQSLAALQEQGLADAEDDEMVDADESLNREYKDGDEDIQELVSESDLNSRSRPGSCTFADARILVVCNKYETGYDDPGLWFMYVDKPLRGSRAVQTLGRLARIYKVSEDGELDGGTAGSMPLEGSSGSPPRGHIATTKLVKVVDFVNVAGSIQESFEEFAGMTQFRTGEKAKTLRRERVMDHCVSRLLHILLPLLDKHCPEGLQGATTHQVAAATRMLPHDLQLVVMEDLGRYCTACESSKRQKAEMPYAWANKLSLTLRQQGSADARQQSTGTKLSSDGGLQEASDDLEGFQVEVRTLQETFAGRINLHRKSVPLQSMPYSKASSSGRDSTGAAASSKVTASAAKEVAKLPLLEAIKAANEALSGDFERHAQSALLQIKERLQEALGNRSPQGSGLVQSNHPLAEDIGEAAAMLRRLQLHVVDSTALIKTGFAALIKGLKNHRDKEIGALARALIRSWKAQLKQSESKNNSAANSGASASGSDGAALHNKVGPQNLPPGVVSTGDQVRDKGRVFLLQAIKQGMDSGNQMSASWTEKAAYMASAVENAAFQHASARETGPAYRSKLRELASNLKRQGSDLSKRLIEGNITPKGLVSMDKKDFAPEEVRRVVEAVEQRHQREIERLTKAAGDGASGGTFVNTDISCPECGATRVAVHTCLTGGTYAEERTIMQKNECRECLHTWRT